MSSLLEISGALAPGEGPRLVMLRWLGEQPLRGVSSCSATRERGSDRVSRQHPGARAVSGELSNLLSAVMLHDRLPAFFVTSLSI